MCKTQIILISIAIGVFCSGTPMLANDFGGASQDWEVIKSLSKGDRLMVYLKDGQHFKGKFLSASETLLGLKRRGDAMNCERDEIVKVYRYSGRTTTKRTLIGLGVGLGAGLAVGYGISTKADNVIFCSVAAGIGAAAGGFSGWISGRCQKDLIYEAPSQK